jgi:hypothetical protein
MEDGKETRAVLGTKGPRRRRTGAAGTRAKRQSQLLATGSGRRRRQSQEHDSKGPHQEKQGFSQRLNLMAWVRALRCNSVYVMRFRSMRIPVSVRASYNMADVKALVDSGATDNFMHPNFAKRMKIGKRELDKPKNIYNIDDTTNRAGQITHYLNLAVTTGGKTKEMRFLITDIGQEDVLLGYPWLSMYEPRFSWKHGTIDESNLPIILRTINPSEQRDVVARYLSTDE